MMLGLSPESHVILALGRMGAAIIPMAQLNAVIEKYRGLLRLSPERALVNIDMAGAWFCSNVVGL